MNHALFGARIEYGDPLFLTVSPSASHSGLCIRLSRYRYEDPAVRCNLDDKTNFRPWAGADKPSLWVNESEDAVIMDFPEYEVRRAAVSRDPWCVVLAFLHSAKFVLPAGLGIQMCPQCPHCNHDGSVTPCQTIFGHNMRPTGGAAGLGVASGERLSINSATIRMCMRMYTLQMFISITLWLRSEKSCSRISCN